MNNIPLLYILFVLFKNSWRTLEMLKGYIDRLVLSSFQKEEYILFCCTANNLKISVPHKNKHFFVSLPDVQGTWAAPLQTVQGLVQVSSTCPLPVRPAIPGMGGFHGEWQYLRGEWTSNAFRARACTYSNLFGLHIAMSNVNAEGNRICQLHWESCNVTQQKKMIYFSNTGKWGISNNNPIYHWEFIMENIEELIPSKFQKRLLNAWSMGT